LCVGETTKTRWWKRGDTMVNDDVTMVKVRCYDKMSLRSHDSENAILFSQTCHRVLIIVPSQFHLCIIVHSFSGRQNVTYVQTEHRNRFILNDTILWLDSHHAEILRLAPRSSTRDKKWIPDHIPLSSIPFKVYIKSRKCPLRLRNALICILQKPFIFAY
jgi:hypothetical protein